MLVCFVSTQQAFQGIARLIVCVIPECKLGKKEVWGERRKKEEGLLHFQEVNGKKKKNKRPSSAHGVSPWNTKQFPWQGEVFLLSNFVCT